MPIEQKFEIGYHLNTWDFEGRPEEGFPFLAEVGFVWYEALIFNSLSDYFARRFMTLEDSGPPAMLTDTDFLRRMHLYNKAQEDYGLRLVCRRRRHPAQHGHHTSHRALRRDAALVHRRLDRRRRQELSAPRKRIVGESLGSPSRAQNL